MGKEKKRDEINDEVKWDLSSLYTNEDQWFNDLNTLEKEIEKFSQFDGTLNTASKLLEYLKFEDQVSIKLEKLYTYAHLKFDEDTTNAKTQAMKGKASKLYADFSLATSFVIPELMKLSLTDIQDFLKKEPLLKEYEYNLLNIMRFKPHVLSNSEEKLLSQLQRTLDNPEATAAYLRDADMKFGFIHDENGNEVELTNSNYSVYIASENREVRKAAFYTLYKAYKNLQNTFASAYYGKVIYDNTNAQIRNYKDARTAALFGSNISDEIYDNLIVTVNKNLKIMDKYYKMKKEVMGLDEIHIYDIYSPLLPASTKKYTFEEAKNIVIEALSILGKQYISDLEKAFSQRWIDIYPNKGKRDGAYSSGSYTSYPYVLLNFNGLFHDVSTLAHELGHSMHSYYSIKNNVYSNYSYQIFVAEVASQVNEIILARYLIDKADNKNEKLTILDNLMELFKSSIVRQTMFAEFEQLTHKSEQEGEVLTSEFLGDNYYKLYQKYSGNEMISDKEIRYEWERIPHFYYNFYVYQYSTGLAAACYIADGIINKKEGALDKYLQFLTLGGSMDPVDELKVAGVDISSPEVIQTAMDMFDKTIDEFKKIYNEK